MADDVTYTSTAPAGVPNATKQVTDEHATRGHMPIVKLAYSADGDATPVSADASGLLVNLGTNNDVVVSDGGGSLTVDGPLTDAQLRASAVPVSDNGSSLTVDGPLTDTELRATAVPVSMASPPTGSATAANQATEITALGSLLTELQTKTEPADQQHTIVDSSALPSGAATGTKQDTGNVSLASIDTKVPALGQALAAASVPVVLTAAQLTTITPPAAITGFATESTLDTRTGALTETAPATDTASSGINGRLQRIAQRITSLIALIPASLGQKAKTASFAVVLASDQDPIAATQSGTWTEANSAAIAASLSVVDDWDETDRAKVNSIVGQAGVAAGAGAVSATVQRMTLASDDPAVASLSVIDDWDESDRAKVNPIAGQAGVQGGSGAVSALTQRVVLATDVALPAGTNAIGSIEGTVAHDSGGTGIKPLLQGALASAHGTNPTAVTADDITRLLANRAGVPFVIGGHPNPVCVRLNYTSAQTDVAIVTVSTGLKIVVTAIDVMADHANAADAQVRIGFAATTTPTTTGVILSHAGIAPGSGISKGNGGGILGVGADGEDLRVTGEAASSGMDIVVTYYTIES